MAEQVVIVGGGPAGQMVLKPAPVLHVMMSVMGFMMLFMRAKLQRGDGIALPEPKFLTAVRV